MGASGGIDQRWYIFDDCFKAVGFDPLVKECERLNSLSINENVYYVSGFVGCEGKEFPDGKNKIFNRLSCYVASKILGLDSVRMYNSFQEVVFSEKKICLSEYFKQRRWELDFLKIDTDGHELEVLYGAEELFSQNQFLGILVEVPLHGEVHPLSNTFANIDIFLRKRGFTLFDINIYRYSRKDLPGKFLLDIPAQTDFGQVIWGDALYLRDIGDYEYIQKYNYAIDEKKVLKFICIHELFGLNDCAIELFNIFSDKIELLKKHKELRELLVPYDDGLCTIDDYFKRFDEFVLYSKYKLEHKFEEYKSKLKKYKKIAFFGAGGRLRSNIEFLLSFLSVDSKIFIFDNDQNKWGKCIGEVEIYPPYEIKNVAPDIIIITSTFSNEIFQQLMEIHKINNLTFEILFF